MIGSLRGKILDKKPPEILIEVGGVGYEVLMPISAFCKIGEIGSDLFVYTSFVVREDAQMLFGFLTSDEKILFRELIKVSGVGPKTALAIIATMTPQSFVNAVRNERANELIKVPGIGKRGAERIIVEIKDKVASYGISADATTDITLTTTQIDEVKDEQDNTFSKNIEQQAIDAFIGLGYNLKQASSLVQKYCKDGMSVEEVIKEVLKNI